MSNLFLKLCFLRSFVIPNLHCTVLSRIYLITATAPLQIVSTVFTIRQKVCNATFTNTHEIHPAKGNIWPTPSAANYDGALSPVLSYTMLAMHDSYMVARHAQSQSACSQNIYNKLAFKQGKALHSKVCRQHYCNNSLCVCAHWMCPIRVGFRGFNVGLCRLRPVTDQGWINVTFCTKN